MNVLMLSTTDITGGAARAAYRIHKGLQYQGLNSLMLVQKKDSDDPTTIGPAGRKDRAFNQLRPYIDSLPLQLYRNREDTEWSAGWLPQNLKDQINRLSPDIINLHWISGGFLPFKVLQKFNKPLVWTLHDCWAFTGGCHYPFDCSRYKQKCGCCPQLGSRHAWDLSRWVWQRKFRHWDKNNLTVVTPSRWLAKLAKSSSLFSHVRVEVIPYCLDLTRYKPIDKNIARDILGLPRDKKLILFSSLNKRHKRKGFHYLRQALQYLYDGGAKRDLQLVTVGASQESELVEIGFDCVKVGILNDDISLALFNAAADVFVAPSMEDNLPLTVLEAMACGTPTVAFEVGGIPDLIEHQQTGYLTRPFDTEDLARGITWILADPDRQRALGRAARIKAEQEFSIPVVSEKYKALLNELISSYKDSH